MAERCRCEEDAQRADGLKALSHSATECGNLHDPEIRLPLWGLSYRVDFDFPPPCGELQEQF